MADPLAWCSVVYLLGGACREGIAGGRKLRVCTSWMLPPEMGTVH